MHSGCVPVSVPNLHIERGGGLLVGECGGVVGAKRGHKCNKCQCRGCMVKMKEILGLLTDRRITSPHSGNWKGI